MYIYFFLSSSTFYPSIQQSVYLQSYLYIPLPIPVSIYLSIFIYMYLSICESIYSSLQISQIPLEIFRFVSNHNLSKVKNYLAPKSVIFHGLDETAILKWRKIPEHSDRKPRQWSAMPVFIFFLLCFNTQNASKNWFGR